MSDFNYEAAIKEAEEAEKNNESEKALEIYKKIISADVGRKRELAYKYKEEAIFNLGKLLAKQG
jgi:hypothetical protein